jgi:hypothetical protein
MSVARADLKGLLGARHEDGLYLTEAVQPSELDVPAVHHVDGARLQEQLVEEANIVHLALRHPDERADVSPQISTVCSLIAALVRRKCA